MASIDQAELSGQHPQDPSQQPDNQTKISPRLQDSDLKPAKTTQEAIADAEELTRMPPANSNSYPDTTSISNTTTPEATKSTRTGSLQPAGVGADIAPSPNEESNEDGNGGAEEPSSAPKSETRPELDPDLVANQDQDQPLASGATGVQQQEQDLPERDGAEPLLPSLPPESPPMPEAEPTLASNAVESEADLKAELGGGVAVNKEAAQSEEDPDGGQLEPSGPEAERPSEKLEGLKQEVYDEEKGKEEKEKEEEEKEEEKDRGLSEVDAGPVATGVSASFDESGAEVAPASPDGEGDDATAGLPKTPSVRVEEGAQQGGAAAGDADADPAGAAEAAERDVAGDAPEPGGAQDSLQRSRDGSTAPDPEVSEQEEDAGGLATSVAAGDGNDTPGVLEAVAEAICGEAGMAYDEAAMVGAAADAHADVVGGEVCEEEAEEEEEEKVKVKEGVDPDLDLSEQGQSDKSKGPLVTAASSDPGVDVDVDTGADGAAAEVEEPPDGVDEPPRDLAAVEGAHVSEPPGKSATRQADGGHENGRGTGSSTGSSKKGDSSRSGSGTGQRADSGRTSAAAKAPAAGSKAAQGPSAAAAAIASDSGGDAEDGGVYDDNDVSADSDVNQEPDQLDGDDPLSAPSPSGAKEDGGTRNSSLAGGSGNGAAAVTSPPSQAPKVVPPLVFPPIPNASPPDSPAQSPPKPQVRHPNGAQSTKPSRPPPPPSLSPPQQRPPPPSKRQDPQQANGAGRGQRGPEKPAAPGKAQAAAPAEPKTDGQRRGSNPRQLQAAPNSSPTKPQRQLQQQQQPQEAKEAKPAEAQPQRQQAAKPAPAAISSGGDDGGKEPSSAKRPARLKDVLAASEAPDPDSITQQYLKMLHGGVLQRPNTAPEGPTDTGGAKNAAGSGAAAVMALSCPPSTGQTQQQQHPSSRQPPQQPQRPSTGRSTCSGSSNLTAQGIELARLQARTAWDVSPLQRGEPQSTAGTHKLPPLHTSGGGGGGGQTSPQSPISPIHASGVAAAKWPAADGAPPPPRIFIPRPTASAAPYPPIYSPGPGAYSPTVFRRGDHSSLGGQSFGGGSPPRAWAFGSANQRPRHVCLHFRDDSPGPVYLPSKDRLSTSPCPVNHKFDHNLTGGRYSLTAGQPGNAPMFNPGPGTYEPATTAAGDSLSPGRSGAMPAYSFSHTRKLLIPAIDGAALPVLSKEHVREYYGTLSPGPAHYSPETSPTRMAAPAYSIKGRRACWFDPLELSPGPIYKPNELDRRGGHSLGDAPYATIGKGPKFHDPTGALSASAWLSFNHARRANYGIHSPGPVYLPNDPRVPRVPSPSLATGPLDRFTARNETGRLQ